MPYAKSAARRVFEAELAKQVAVVRSVGPTKVGDPTIRAYVCSSAVALTSAALELYFETLVFQWVALVKANGLTYLTLPKQLRWFIFFETMIRNHTERFAVIGDEQEFLSNIKNAWGHGQWEMLDDAKVVSPAAQLNRVLSQKRYPSPKNVRTVFGRLGVDQVFHKLNAAASTDVEALLKSFNDVRNDFAHDGVLVGYSVRDVIRVIKNLTRVTNAIDRVFFKHIVATYGASCWPA